MQKQSTKIREIFTSIQGEGPYVGQKHIFVRFCKCNLNCAYCDTDFNSQNAKDYNIDDLALNLADNDAEVISFTGGEPLLELDFLKEFLCEYKSKLNKKIYLETNGTLYKNLAQIIDYIDIILMDIKLESATGQKNLFFENEEFLKIAQKKETFIKAVFDENISDDEIEKVTYLAKKYNTLLILQPKMPINKGLDLDNIYNKFYKKYKNIRLIPQVHKYLNLA